MKTPNPDPWPLMAAFFTILVILAGVVLFATKSTSAEQESEKHWIIWQKVGNYIHRTPTPGGWIVFRETGALLYVPDTNHEWLKQ